MMKKPMLVAHGIVFLLGLILSTVLLVIGYNTELMFILAIVISGWIYVHLILGLIQFLVWLGRKRTGAATSEVWPLLLILTLVVYFLLSCQALASLEFFLRKAAPWTVWRTVEAVLVFFPLIPFLGILLRFAWARILGGAGLILLGLSYLVTYVVTLNNVHTRLNLPDLILYGGLQTSLVVLGIVFLRSQKVRAFFETRKNHGY